MWVDLNLHRRYSSLSQVTPRDYARWLGIAEKLAAMF